MHPLVAVVPSLLLAATAAATDLAVLEEAHVARASMQDESVTSPRASSSEGWEFRLSPYLWIPAQSGTIGFGPVSLSVDMSTADTWSTITENFNFAAAMRLQARHGDLTLFGDAMYLSLESDDIALSEDQSATLRQDQGLFELGAGLVVHETKRTDDAIGFTFEPLAGVRIYTLDVEVNSTSELDPATNHAWVDGFAGARATFECNDWLSLHVRGDIGGGGSDFCWNAEAGFDIRMSESGVLNLGFRALSTDYTTGSGADRFEYDVVMYGPYIAFTLAF